MSQFAIEDLFRTAAGDGATIPSRMPAAAMDSRELLEAWNIERGHTIECELLLKVLRKAIARSLQTNVGQSATERRNHRDLIRQIDGRLKKSPSRRP